MSAGLKYAARQWGLRRSGFLAQSLLQPGALLIHTVLVLIFAL